MPDSSQYYLVEEGQRTGPHTIAVLKQKAEIHVLTADTLITKESEPTAWKPLSASPQLCAELIPTRTRLTLGSHVIEQVNKNGDAAAPSVEELLQGNLSREKAIRGELLTPMPPRSNRRRSDYLIMLALGNLSALAAYLFLPANPMVLVSLGSFVALYNVGLVWILYGVMDRY